jgi:hypothetical protein
MQGSPELLYQLSIGLEVRSFGIVMYPMLGVQHPEASRLARQFLGLPPGIGAGISIFGRSLPDLLREHGREVIPSTRWLIHSAEDVAPVTDVCRQDIEFYGIPFLQRFRTIGDVIFHLERQQPSQQNNGLLAITRALAGSFTEASVALRAYAAEAQSQQPPMSTQSWRFVQLFTEHFGQAAP